MMKNENKGVPALYAALSSELKNRKPALSLRTLGMLGGRQLCLSPAGSRFFAGILENHILDGKRSVVFTIEAAEDFFLLRFCCPLTEMQYRRMAALDYAPLLRTTLYLSAGLGLQPPYAYSAVRLSLYGSVVDFFDALALLKRELEKFMLAGGNQ